MKRGVLIPPIGTSHDKDGTNIFTHGDFPFLEVAPSAVLYWDKIYAPIAIRGMMPQYDGAVDRLVSLGVAESFDLKSENRFSSDELILLLEKYAAGVAHLNEKDNEVWSILPPTTNKTATLSNQASAFFKPSNNTMASIEVSLKNALPVPDRAVPYEDILEFRAARKDQLNRLHSEISQIASRYLNHGDDRIALELSLADLRTALSELQTVYGEKWEITSLKKFTMAFALYGVVPMGFTYGFGAPIDSAFLAGLGTTITQTAISASLSGKHKHNPFSYALEAQRL